MGRTDALTFPRSTLAPVGAASTVEHTYAYAGLSACGMVGDRRDAYLSSSGGSAAHPHFFSGFLERPRRNGALLLAVARVARARFYTPGSMTAAVLRAADPVVTSSADQLRFESFSACNTVYARLDLTNNVLSGDLARSGTTNVDFNLDMRQALNWLEEDDLVHLDVGPDEVRLATLGGTVVERRVPLPTRWLRGFGEVQLAQASMTPRFELTGPVARRALSELALVKGKGERWVRPYPQGVLVAEDPTPTPNEPAVVVDGIECLRPFAEHARHARALRVYSTGEDDWAASAWELIFEGATLTVVLSPQIDRGFSGEGQVLTALTDHHAVSTAEVIRGLAAAKAQIDVPALANEAGLEVDLVARSLAVLSGLGLLGYDLSLGGYFSRHLPFDADALSALHPRLADAHKLAGDMAVREEGVDGDEFVATVVSGKNEYRVRTSPHAGSFSCTCRWYTGKGARQGPCKHVLAVRLQQASTVPSQP